MQGHAPWMEGAPERPRVLSAAQLRELQRQELASPAAAAAGGRQRAAPRVGPPGGGPPAEDPRWAGMKAGAIAASRASPAAGAVSLEGNLTHCTGIGRISIDCTKRVTILFYRYWLSGEFLS